MPSPAFRATLAFSVGAFAAGNAPFLRPNTQDNDDTESTFGAVPRELFAIDLFDSAVCRPNLGVLAEVGDEQHVTFPDKEVKTGDSASTGCETINSGYGGNTKLTCSSGVLAADVTQCAKKDCGTTFEVKVGSDTKSITLSEVLSSGKTATEKCAAVNPGWSGDYSLACNLGAATVDVSKCVSACLAGADKITITVGGTAKEWTLTDDLANDASSTVQCSSLDAEYSGTATVRCSNNDLQLVSANCLAKSCDTGSSIDLVLDKITKQWQLTSTVESGKTTKVTCDKVNPDYTGNVVLTCTKGKLSYVSTGCLLKCKTTDRAMFPFAASYVPIRPVADIESGKEESHQCSEISSSLSGTFAVKCVGQGELQFGTASCAETGCSADTSASSFRCADINPVVKTGSDFKVVSCSRATVSEGSVACTTQACETYHVTSGTVNGKTGLATPKNRIASGSQGVGDCSNINEDYSGDLDLDCNNGTLRVTSASKCSLTCMAPRSKVDVTFGGASHEVTPSQRVPNGADFQESCSTVSAGYSGNIKLKCDAGKVTFVSHDCVKACPATSTVPLSLDDVQYKASPTNAIPFGGSLSVDCKSFAPGFSGTVSLACSSTGVFSAGSVTCKQDPCMLVSSSGSSSSSGTGVGFDVRTLSQSFFDATNSPFKDNAIDAKTVWSVDCSTLSDVLAGKFEARCFAGQIKWNTATCTGPCSTKTAEVKLGEDVSSDYTKSKTFQAGAWEQQFSSNWNIKCSDVHDEYEGDLKFTCTTTGEFTVSKSGCSRIDYGCSKERKTSVKVTVGQNTAVWTPITAMKSGQVVTAACKDLNPAYKGDIVFQCGIFGSLVADTSKCEYSLCAKGSRAQVLIGGYVHEISIPDPLEPLAGYNMQCEDVRPGFEGNLWVFCEHGGLVTRATECTPKGCKKAGSTKVKMNNKEHTLVIQSDLKSGQGVSWTCSDGNSDYTGSAKLTCSMGELIVDMTGCTCAKDACKDAQCSGGIETKVMIGDAVGTTHPTITTLNDGAIYSEACDAIVQGWTDNVALTCKDGLVIPDSAKCARKSCTAPKTLLDRLGYSGTTLSGVDPLVHDATSEATCESFKTHGNYGNVPILCANGNYYLDFTGCSRTPIPTTTTTTTTLPSGAITSTVKVVESKMGFSCGSAMSSTSLKSAMTSSAGLDAIRKSLAASLGVPPEDIYVTSVIVDKGVSVDASNTPTTRDVNVEFQVKTDSQDENTAITNKIKKFEESSSIETSKFKSSLATNVKEAGDSTGSTEMKQLSTDIQQGGVRITSVSEPTIVEKQVVTGVADRQTDDLDWEGWEWWVWLLVMLVTLCILLVCFAAFLACLGMMTAGGAVFQGLMGVGASYGLWPLTGYLDPEKGRE